jgi:hypothetical protein
LKLVFIAAIGSSLRKTTSAGANQYAIANGSPKSERDQQRDERAEPEARHHRKARLNGSPLSNALRPPTPIVAIRHAPMISTITNDPTQVDDADDEQRTEPIEKAREQMPYGQRAAAIERAASDEDAAGEHRRQQRCLRGLRSTG